jgi:hypothetical protein
MLAFGAMEQIKSNSVVPGCLGRTSFYIVAIQNIKQLRQNAALIKKYWCPHGCDFVS